MRIKHRFKQPTNNLESRDIFSGTRHLGADVFQFSIDYCPIRGIRSRVIRDSRLASHFAYYIFVGADFGFRSSTMYRRPPREISICTRHTSAVFPRIGGATRSSLKSGPRKKLVSRDSPCNFAYTFRSNREGEILRISRVSSRHSRISYLPAIL